MSTLVIGDGEKIITTVLLNGERLHIRVHPHANGQNVFDSIVKYIGLTEVSYFGLMIIKDGEQQFLGLEEKLNKLSKYAPHLWKDDGSCNSSLVFTVFFRVKYYVENISFLYEQQTRHQYYLQLRKDVLENSIRIHDDTSMILASYALQAEIGDYDKNLHGFDYFVAQHYLPAKTIAKLTVPYIRTALPAMHQSHQGLTEGQAEIEFLKEAQKLSEYGVLFHRVYKKDYNKRLAFNLGVCVRGLVLYEETGAVRNPVCKHPWSKIKKMSFKRSQFIIDVDSSSSSKILLYTTSYKRSRYLLKICSSFFNFQTMMSTKIAMAPEFLFQNLDSKSSHSVLIPSVRIEPATQVIDNTTDLLGSQKRTVTAKAQPLMQTTVSEAPTPIVQQQKPEVKQYTQDLMKHEGSFGFSIVGGIELGGIFVKDVTAGGPAAHCGKINAGDRIVQINKDSFENVTRREAINTLRTAPEKSKFIMETFCQNLNVKTNTALNSKSVPPPHAVCFQATTDKVDTEFVQVDLLKRDNTFGISFTGGPELGGVYVKSLLPHGSAEVDGRVALGDRIVEVNHTNVENMHKRKIQDLLKQTDGQVTILVERFKYLPSAADHLYIDREKVLQSSHNFTSITLCKKNESLGFSITGGLDLGGIFVKYLNPNGPASLDQRLEIGDRVVAVNDVCLETVTRLKALEILRNATSPVNLIVEKCLSCVHNKNSLVRSDSIKSLPSAHRVKNLGMQSPSMNYSMQHLPRSGNIFQHLPLVNQQVHQRKPSESKRKDIFAVDVKKQNGVFGFTLTERPGNEGIFVKSVQLASLTAKIQQGDRVIEINARKMDGLNENEANDWLKCCGSMITIILERGHFDYYRCVEVQLQRKNHSFGLCLVRGVKHQGVFIKKLLDGCVAKADGQLEVGDRVIEINGVNVDGFNQMQTHNMLKQALNVHLLVEKIHRFSELSDDVFSVQVKKEEHTCGISVAGSCEVGGIFVKGLRPGSPADMASKIQKGDRIMEVNGISTNYLSKHEVQELLNKSPDPISLVLERNGCFDNIILPESAYFTVELHKKNSGYGLNLTGGPEINGVHVKHIQRDSAADHDGRIKKGDRLITVNGRNVEGSTRQKCTEMLKLTHDIAVLHLERCVVGDDLPPLDTVLAVVKLSKESSGFGISLMGGPDVGGIFVKALLAGGSAERDGRVFKGDRLVEINSQSLDGFTKQQATELLKNCSNCATFILERYKMTFNQRLLFNRSLSIDSLKGGKQSEALFPFPMCAGAAPSVPPRHHANCVPFRESAFKRFEQQQRKSVQSPHNTPQTSSQHNIQGTTVSSRLPTYIEQQSSIDRDYHERDQANYPEHREEAGFQYKMQNENKSNPVDIVNAPLQMLVSSEMEDSPQKFIQKMSKSVAPIEKSSRVPLGPISSAIFGGNRDGRNMHEIYENKCYRGIKYEDRFHKPTPEHEGNNCISTPVSRNTVVALVNGVPTGGNTIVTNQWLQGDDDSVHENVSPKEFLHTPLESSPGSLDSISVNSHEPKTSGLLWISLNSNGTSDLETFSPQKRDEPPPPSSTIPVPLASKFDESSSNFRGDHLFEVTLFKGENGLGMNLVGGGDTPLKIKKIAAGTAADMCGLLMVSDDLLEVNGQKVDHMKAKDVIAILRACSAEVQLLVKRSVCNERSAYQGL